MSREILIVGSGFMGTSMAHALENCNISCFETHEAYLATIKKLNIYKNIFSDVSDIKGEFDLIIICTRQKDVLEHISYFSSKFPESLITDISSSKNFLQEADLPPNFISSPLISFISITSALLMLLSKSDILPSIRLCCSLAY